MTVTGRRTTLRPGRRLDYLRLHSTVPAALHEAFLSAGILSWRIWIDGSVLFHAIETTGPLDVSLASLERSGPVDPEWNAMIEEIMDSDPRSDVTLTLVWGMSKFGQFSDPASTV